jgi:hypothetical protein
MQYVNNYFIKGNMKNIALKKRLSELGITMAVIAKMLGFSRQWFYIMIKIDSTEWHPQLKEGLRLHIKKVEKLIDDL